MNVIPLGEAISRIIQLLQSQIIDFGSFQITFLTAIILFVIFSILLNITSR